MKYRFSFCLYAFTIFVLACACDVCAEEVRMLGEVPAWNAMTPEKTLDWFNYYEYGYPPPGADRPDLSFAAAGPDRVMMDGRALRKRVRITYRGPYGTNAFVVTAFIPEGAKKPVPAFLYVNIGQEPEKIIDPERNNRHHRWPAEEIVRRGYAAVAFHNGDITPDWETGGTKGVFACYEKEGPYRDLSRWGVLRAWAWGASRVLDWIETEPLLDAKHVAVVGHSRGGKTALVAGVTDKRFAMACVNDSGCSGMKLNRMDLPKSEQTVFMSARLGYWFCGNYRLWAHDPVKLAACDQHQFAALMAPRLLAVASASLDAWAGPRGEFESCRLASGAWEAHGLKGLVADAFPAPGTALQEGCISYHLRAGEHDIADFDWKCYMDFADRHGWRNATNGEKK